MTTTYTKPYKNPSDLVALLQSRGLHISNPQKAESILRAVGYYRFSAYLYKLLKEFPMVDVAAMGFPERWEEEPLWQ